MQLYYTPIGQPFSTQTISIALCSLDLSRFCIRMFLLIIVYWQTHTYEKKTDSTNLSFTRIVKLHAYTKKQHIHQNNHTITYLLLDCYILSDSVSKQIYRHEHPHDINAHAKVVKEEIVSEIFDYTHNQKEKNERYSSFEHKSEYIQRHRWKASWNIMRYLQKCWHYTK